MSSREDFLKFFLEEISNLKNLILQNQPLSANLFYHNVSKKLYWKKDVLQKCLLIIPNLEDNTFLQVQGEKVARI